MRQQTQDEIRELRLLRTLVRVTGEIASNRMQRARGEVLYRRFFLDELMQVFNEVRRGFLHQFRNLSQSQHSEKLSSEITKLAHNGKTVSVLLSANTRLYGDLLTRTFDLFYQDVLEQKSEVTIVGKVGLSMYRERAGDAPVTYFEFNDQLLTNEALGELAKHLVSYEAIHVFYGKYENPVRQDATEFVISADMPLSETERQRAYVDYIFEPSLKEVLLFFEKEIFNTMLEQTVIESQLAKFASRFVAMDRAEVQIGKELKRMKTLALRERHVAQNKKQLNMVTPILSRMAR